MHGKQIVLSIAAASRTSVPVRTDVRDNDVQRIHDAKRMPAYRGAQLTFQLACQSI